MKFVKKLVVLAGLVGMIFPVAQAQRASMKFGQGELVSPAAAVNILSSGTDSDQYGRMRSKEIQSLARSLNYDPFQMFEYVRNNIEIYPTFGLSKGALGAHLDKSGTAFDQAHLLFELLDEAALNGAPVSGLQYHIGDVTMSGAEFSSWMDIPDSGVQACNLLANGGIPGVHGCGSGPIGSITFLHIWVSANVSGQNVTFDPSIKRHSNVSPLTVGSNNWQQFLQSGSGVTCTGSALRSASAPVTQSAPGATSKFAQGFNDTALQSKMEACNNKLWSWLESNRPDASLDDILGYRRIIPAADNETVHPSASYSSPRLTDTIIPFGFRTKITLRYVMGTSTELVNMSYFAEEIYGRRIYLEPNGFVLDPSQGGTSGGDTGEPLSPVVPANPYPPGVRLCELSPEDCNTNTGGGTQPQVQKITVPPAPPSSCSYPIAYIYKVVFPGGSFTTNCAPPQRNGIATLVIDVPYASKASPSDADGTYLDRSFSQALNLVTRATMVYNAGDASGTWERYYTRLLGSDRKTFWVREPGQSCPGECDPPDWIGDNPYGPRLAENIRFRLHGAWAQQNSRLVNILDQISPGRVAHHYSLGWVSARTTVQHRGETGAPETLQSEFAVGEEAVTLSIVSAFMDSQDGVAAVPYRRVLANLSATLESSVFEQLFDATATGGVAQKFRWANLVAKSAEEYEPSGNPGVVYSDDVDGAYKFFGFDTIDPNAYSGVLYPPLYALTSDGGVSSEANNVDACRNTGTYTSKCREAGLRGAIQGYLGAGFNVVSAQDAYMGPGMRCGLVLDGTTGNPKCNDNPTRGGAFIAYKPDYSEVAFVQYVAGRIYKGGGAGSAAPHELQGYQIPTAADLLKQQEDVNWAHNVDLKTGKMTYSEGSLLSTGTLEFPYSLSFERTFESGERLPDDPFWKHNWDMPLTISGSGSESFGASRGLFSAPTLSTVSLLLDLYDVQTGSGTVEEAIIPETVGALAAAWWSDQLTFNTVSASFGGETEQFYRKPGSNQFFPASGSTARLQQFGGRYEGQPNTIGPPNIQPTTTIWRYENLSFVLTNPGQDTITYAYWDSYYREFWDQLDYGNDGSNLDDPLFGPQSGPGEKHGFHATSWSFPYGVQINLNYSIGGGCSWSTKCTRPLLNSVSNNIGQTLGFSGQARDPYQVSAGTRTFTFPNPTPGSSAEPGIYDTMIAADGKQTTYVLEAAGSGFVVGRVLLPGDTYSTPSARYSFDPSGKVASYIDAVGNTWTYRIAGERIAFVQSPTSTAPDVSYFDKLGRGYRTVSSVGVEARQTFDGLGRVLSSEVGYAASPGAFEQKTTYAYDLRGNQICAAQHSVNGDPNADTCTRQPGVADAPLVTTRTFDPVFNQVLTETDPLGIVTVQNTYDPSTGLLMSSDGSSGERMDYLYNGYGQVREEKQKLNATENLVATYVYGGTNGYITDLVMDSSGLNLVTQFGYDAAGNLDSVTNPRGFETRATYDTMRRMVSLTDPVGGGADYEYDNRGRPEFVKVRKADGSFATSQIQYTATGRPETVTDPDNDTILYSYDGADRLDIVTDADGLKTQYQYDNAGRVARIIKGVGTPLEQVEVENTYDWAGDLSRLRPARGVKQNTSIYDTVWTRDPYGRANAGMTYADGSEVKNWFDAVGRIEKTMTRQILASPTADYDYVTNAYDNSGRPVRTVQRDRRYANQMREERKIEYDLAGRITREYELGDDGVFTPGVDEEVIYDYDLLGRLLSETSNGRTVSYGYDDAGNRTSIAWPDNTVATYTFDALNRLDTVRYNGQLLADYDYDLRSRLVSAAMGNGTTANLGYEDDDDFTALYYAFSGETQGFAYGYTGAGRLNSKGYSDPAMAWTPPANSELFSYASLTLPGEAANVLDQYEAIVRPADTLDLDYDQRGNLTDISGGAQARAYTYTLDNRMESAQVGALSIAYDYDVIGRRVGKDVGGQETRYLHAGDMEIAEYDSAGTLLRRYIPGGAIDARVAWVEVAGDGSETLEYYHADRQGSVIAMSDAAGTVSDRYAYDPYGNEMAGASQGGNLFRYTGRKYDPETGLYYYRARYYDPEMGRFLQTDPVGYADQFNLYTYVGNDPLNATDPSGMYCNALNSGSLFCKRSQLFANIDQYRFGQTTFFAAASLTTEALASIDGPGSSFVTSPSTRRHLHQLSTQLEKMNVDIAETISTAPSPVGDVRAFNDRAIVRIEQSAVQNYLDALQVDNPDEYKKLITEANQSLNGIGSRVDKKYAKILRGVKKDLGGQIDFSNEEHRIAIGDALTAAIRNDEKVTCTGSHIKRRSC